MADCGVEWRSLSAAGVVVMTLAMQAETVLTAGDQRSRQQCAWHQYHDPVMDDCAPCREICDTMTLTDTVRQCNDECADYLVSMNCRLDQDFNEAIRNCSPCTELCSQGGDKGAATRRCSQKCRKYLDARKPSKTGTGKTVKTDQSLSSSDSTSAWLPGIIASATLGVIVVTAVIGVAFRRYISQPGTNVSFQSGTTNGVNNSNSTVIAMETVPLNSPVQVSSEDVGSEDICLQLVSGSGSSADGEETMAKHVDIGIAECDPAAPSSQACLHVLQQQCH